MSDDLVKRLRESTDWWHSQCSIKMEAAARIEALEACLAKAREGLEEIITVSSEYFVPNDSASLAYKECADIARSTLTAITGDNSQP